MIKTGDVVSLYFLSTQDPGCHPIWEELGRVCLPVVRNVSYPMNPYAFRTCAVGASCHVLKDLKLNIVEFSVFRYTISWYITERDQEIPSFSFTAIWREYFWST